MKYNTRIRVESEKAEVFKNSIKPELSKNISDRADTKIIKGEDGEFVVEVEAKDINALQASVNNVIQLMKTCEKSLKIQKDEKES